LENCRRNAEGVGINVDVDEAIRRFIPGACMHLFLDSFIEELGRTIAST